MLPIPQRPNTVRSFGHIRIAETGRILVFNVFSQRKLLALDRRTDCNLKGRERETWRTFTGGVGGTTRRCSGTGR